MKKNLTILFALFLIKTTSPQCIEDLRALIDDFLEVQTVDLITSNGKGYVGKGYFSSGGNQIYFFSAETGLKTIPETSIAYPIAVSENGNYVVLSFSNGNWSRWETTNGTILQMPFPANRSGYDAVGVTNNGTVFANFLSSQGVLRGYYWTPVNEWETAGATTLQLRGISNDGSTRVGHENSNRPVIWKQSTEDWETMEGFENGGARITDLSGNGLYVTGYYRDQDNNLFCFRWSNGNLELMPGSVDDSDDEGLFITDNGEVLAIESRPPEYTSRYVWWFGGSVTNFYDILIQNGLLPNLIPVLFDDLQPDGTDGAVTFISNDGKAVAGNDSYSNRVVHFTGSCAVGIAARIYQYSVLGGNTLSFSWYASGINGDVIIEWSADGSSYNPIDTVPAIPTSGEYPGWGWYYWSVPNINTENAYIRITASGAEELLGPFSITSSTSIISPAAGVLWIAGETDTIKWTETDWTSVNIKCITNFGTPLQDEIIIVQGAPVSGSSFNWNISDSIFSYRSKIIVENANDDSENAESDIFRIKPYWITRVKSDSTYYAYNINNDRWGFGNDSADVWPEWWFNQFDYRGTDPISGFTFPQAALDSLFYKAKKSDHPDWVSWVNTFGGEACYINLANGVISADALLKWKAKKGIWGGSCFGFAVSNALAFESPDEFLNAYPQFPDFNSPINIGSSNNSIPVINELFTHQYGNPHWFIYQYIQRTPDQTSNELKEILKEDNTSIQTVTIFNNNGPGAHAILGYGLKRDEINPDILNLLVYDNSYPDSLNAQIKINEFINSWTYSNWQGWGGQDGLLLADPANTFLANPHLNKNRLQQSPFILNDTLLQLFNAFNISVEITDKNGNKSGFFDNKLTMEIPGASPFYIINGSEWPPKGYSLKKDNYSFEIFDSKTDTSEIFFFTGNKSFSYERYGVEESETDRLFFDGGISVSNPDQKNKTIKLLNLINESAQEKLTVIRSLNLSQNDSVKIENPDSSKIKLISFGTTKDYDVELNYITGNGVERFGNFNIALSENTSHTFIPDWNDLSNKELKILIDEGNDGTVEDTISLINKITDVEDEGLLLTPHSYNLAQNYPNPFNPTTIINYQLPVGGHITIKIYDILGKEVATLINEEKTAGKYSIDFNAAGLASGIYFYRIHAAHFVQTKKMILLK